MIWLLSFFNFIRRNFMALLVAVFAAFAAMQKNRADRYVRETEELERKAHTLEIEAEAKDLRSRPVPRDNHDILGRM